jgi:hypothetical protein
LDIGYANAEPRYLQALDALGISFLVGPDISQLSQPGIFSVAADVCWPPFRDGAFDLINAISVIEHIGRDNSVYHHRDQVIQEFGDLEAGARLTPLLRPGDTSWLPCHLADWKTMAGLFNMTLTV